MKNKNILLVESSATLRHILKRMLKGQGYECHALANQDDAIAAITHPPSDEPWNLVLAGWQETELGTPGPLFRFLDDEQRRTIPLVILSQETRESIFVWMSHRPHTAMTLWENHAELPDTIHKVIHLPEQAVPMTLAQKGPTPHQVSILFVDDSPSIRHYYSRMLTQHGYHTLTANSVNEAFDLALQEHFDLAIVDYFMPELDGYVLCQRLRDDPRTNNIRTAVLTGTYMEDAIKESLRAGAMECMFKNEASELFLARIDAMSRFIQVEKSIRQEQQRLASILESVGDGVYGVDSEGHLTFANPAALTMLGYESDETLIGKTAHEIFHHTQADGFPNPIALCRLQSAYEDGEHLKDWSTTFNHTEGDNIPVECTIHPMSGDSGGAVVAFRDVSSRRQMEDQLRWQATHDPLTELFNRRHFEQQLDEELIRVQRGQHTSAVLFLDLDRFKYLNDTAGHQAGDELLIQIGHELRERSRVGDIIARLGGDEFAALMRDIDPKTIHHMAEGFRQILSNCNFVYDNKQYNISGSVGVTLIDDETPSASEVMVQADIACNIAKRKGRNQSHIYDNTDNHKQAMDMALGWSQRIHHALDNDLFVLHYQPIVSMEDLDLDNLPAEDGRLWDRLMDQYTGNAHYEVLVRLEGDDDQALIEPNAFVSTAERFNLMQEIDFWVMEKAMATLAEINNRGQNVTFSINLSGNTLEGERTLGHVQDTVNKLGVNPENVIFEITETNAIANINQAKQLMGRLQSLGFRFALDDFGTGFSTFAQLKHLPVDYVKIDGQFVKSMTRDVNDRAIVTAMNDIAHSLGHATVAEYVENPEILRQLKICGVDYLQGYYLSRPITELAMNHRHRERTVPNLRVL